MDTLNFGSFSSISTEIKKSKISGILFMYKVLLLAFKGKILIRHSHTQKGNNKTCNKLIFYNKHT